MTSSLEAALDRLAPAAPPQAGWWLWLALLGALAALLIPALWLRVRLVVTLSHELGHAVVGVLGGRTFRGFVVNRDMSGHAVTSGKPGGSALVMSTWAGYPAPALLGAALVQGAASGWASTALAILAAVLVIALVFSRSWGTAALVLLAACAAAAGAWWLPREVSAGAVVALGVFLLLGAWRHLGTVMRTGGKSDDPGVLARATRMPAWLWLVSFAIALAACSWWAGAQLVSLADVPFDSFSTLRGLQGW